MPGLKPEEWQNWDSENLSKQVILALNNISYLGKYCHHNFPSAIKLVKIIREKYTKLNLIGKDAQKMGESTKLIFELQRDVGALIVLCDNGFDFERYIGDTTDLYTVAQEFIRQTGTCTDIAIQFPKMVQDAITAIQTDGHQPPAEKMQKAQDYFASRVVVSIGETEAQPLTTEEELYFKAVDDARERVDSTFEQGKIDKFQAYALQAKIDDIMSSKESFVEKRNKLKLIAQN